MSAGERLIRLRIVATMGIAALIGGLGGSSLVGLVSVGGLALSIAAVIAPVSAGLCAIGIRPLIDTFWSTRVVSAGGIGLNAQSILGVLVPPALLLGLYARGWRPRVSVALLGAGVYILVCVWGIWVAPSRSLAIGDFGRLALPLVFLALGEHLAQVGFRPTRLAIILAAYCSVAVLTGVLQLSGLITPREGAVTASGELTRITGLYHHPLDIAWRSAISLPFALMLSRVLNSRSTRTAMLAWALVSAILAFASLARVALVATTIQLITWLWLHGRRKSIMAVLLCVVLVGGLFSQVRIVVQQAVRPLVEGKVYELGTGRGLLFVAQARAFQAGSLTQKILGHGLHSSPGLTIEYNPLPLIDLGGPESVEGQLSAHNQLLRPLVESGIIGAGALLAIFGFGLHFSRKLCRSTWGVEYREAGIATVTLLVGFAVYSISSQPLDRPPITWPIWTVVGYVGALRMVRRTE